jgi:hypothetical protein
VFCPIRTAVADLARSEGAALVAHAPSLCPRPPAHPQLPEEVAAKLDPFESYLGPYLEQVKKEKEEQLKLAK